MSLCHHRYGLKTEFLIMFGGSCFKMGRASAFLKAEVKEPMEEKKFVIKRGVGDLWTKTFWGGKPELRLAGRTNLALRYKGGGFIQAGAVKSYMVGNSMIDSFLSEVRMLPLTNDAGMDRARASGNILSKGVHKASGQCCIKLGTYKTLHNGLFPCTFCVFMYKWNKQVLLPEKWIYQKKKKTNYALFPPSQEHLLIYLLHFPPTSFLSKHIGLLVVPWKLSMLLTRGLAQAILCTRFFFSSIGLAFPWVALYLY